MKSTIKKCVFSILLLFAVVLENSDVRGVEIPDWVRQGRVAGLSLQVTADDNTIEAEVLRLKSQNVSVVELDTALSRYWTDEEFQVEVDFIRRASQVIKANGMKVVIYYPALEVVTYDGEVNPRSAAKEHPDWLQVGINGQANVFYGSKEDWVPPEGESAWMSPNSGYRDYFIGRVKKLAAEAGTDGLWMDVPLYLDTGAPWSDMSPGAREAFEAWSRAQGHNNGQGFLTPAVANINDVGFRMWLEWRHINLAEFIEDVRSQALASNPDWMFVTEVYPMDYMDTLWTGLDGARLQKKDQFIKVWEVDSVSNGQAMKWAHIEDISNRIAKYKYARGVDRDVPSWGFTYGFEVEDAGLGIGAAIATRTIPFETRTPIMTETVDSEMRAKWYGFIRDREEALFRVERLARVGVWFSSATREYYDFSQGGLYGMYLQETPPEPDQDWWAQFTGAGLKKLPHASSWRGAAYGLHQLGISYKCVVDPAVASDLDGLEVLWLPSVVCLSDERAAEIIEFVNAGGTVIATGVMPGTQDEFGNARGSSNLDSLFGFGGSLTSEMRMVEYGQGAAIYRPDINCSDLFTLEGGNTALAQNTLGKLEQLLRIHTTEDIVADLPEGIFMELSEIDAADRQFVYLLNYSGAQQPMVIAPKTLSLQYNVPEGFEVQSITRSAPEGEVLDSPVPFAKTGEHHVGFEVPVEQFAMLTIQLAPETSPLPVEGPDLQFVSAEHEEAAVSGLNFILNTMRAATGKTEPPHSYGVPTNLIDNNFDTFVYTGGHHVTAEHMGLLLRVTALMKNEIGFEQALTFVDEVLMSKGYHVPGWSMDKDRLTRFLQEDLIEGVPVWAAANAPLDDFRVVRGLLQGADRMLNPQARALAEKILNGMYWTSITDRLRGFASRFPNYPDGLVGYSWDWADQDVDGLTPPAKALGLGRLGTFPIPVDYQELETMSLAASVQPRWKGVLASSVDLLLDSEIPQSPGLFYNSLDENNTFSGDFEFPGEPQGNNLKVIQELWIILHLKRVSNAPAYVLDAARRQLSDEAAARGFQFFKDFYLQNSRVPEYLTYGGADVPECGPTPDANCLQRGVQNLFFGEARIYAQLARIALLFGDRDFANQVIAEKILTDRVSDPADPRYGMIGLSTTGAGDAEAWNTLEPLLTICLAALPQGSGNGQNQAPTANPDSILTGTNARREIALTSLLANDTDPEGQILAIQSVSTTSAEGGVLSLAPGRVFYTPPAGFEGMDSFTYTIEDTSGATASTSVMVEVSSQIFIPVGVTVDGDLSDWPQDHPVFTDPDDISAAGARTDLRAIHLHHQDDRLYIAYVNDGPIQLNWGFNLFIDADQNKSTGFTYWEIGADYVINDRTVTRYAGAGTEWSWSFVGDVRIRINENVAEMSFPLDGLGNPEAINVVFEGSNEPYNVSGAVDVVPDSAVLTDGGPRFLTYRLVIPDGILEDGDFADWPANTVVFTDPRESSGGNDQIDMRELRFARDDSKFYVGILNEFPIVMNWGYQVLIDTDNNPETGYRFYQLGADYILYDNGFFRYQGNGSDWNWAFVGSPSSGIQGRVAEFGLPAEWFGPVAPASLRVVFVGDNAANGGTFVDVHPEGSVLADDSPKFVTVEFSSEPPSNIAPTALADTATVDFGETIQINVLANDSDPDGTIDPGTVEIVTAPVAGSATVIPSTGAIAYSHDSRTFSEVVLTYRVADDKGLYSAPATLTISVNPPVTDAPYYPVAGRTIDGDLSEWSDIPAIGTDPRDATLPGDRLDWKSLHLAHNDQSLFMAYESYLPIELNWGHNLYIDTDSSSDTGFRYSTIGADYLIQQGSVYQYTGDGQTWSWAFRTSATQVVSGTVVEMELPRSALGNPNSLRVIWYGENLAYTGGETLDIYPNDNSSVEYTLLAPGQNLPPAGRELTLTTLAGRPLNITLQATDPEGLPVTYNILTQPANGSLGGVAPDLTYTPADGFAGEDSFTWSASDGQLSSGPVDVNISVLPEPDSGYPSHLLSQHTIDGSLTEWADIPVMATDPADATVSGQTSLDWREVRIANSANALLIAARSEAVTPMNWAWNFFIDTDLTETTGFRGTFGDLDIGAELLLQGQYLFRFTGTGPTDWSWQFLTSVTQASTGSTHEWRILLDQLGSPQRIHAVLLADNGAFGSGLPQDYLPDLATAGAQSYLRYEIAAGTSGQTQDGNSGAVDVRRPEPFVIELIPDIPSAINDPGTPGQQSLTTLKLNLMAYQGDVWTMEVSTDLNGWSPLGYIDISGFQKLWAPPILDKDQPAFFRARREVIDFGSPN